MKSDGTERIGEQLILSNKGELTGNRLEFDPQTGELVVRRADDAPNPDATPIDQIATDGFA